MESIVDLNIHHGAPLVKIPKLMNQYILNNDNCHYISTQYSFSTISDTTSWMQVGDWQTKDYQFFKKEPSSYSNINDNDYYSGYVFDELISLSPTSDSIQRDVYDIFGVFGDVGGVMSVFSAISAFLVSQYAELSFRVMAILSVF